MSLTSAMVPPWQLREIIADLEAGNTRLRASNARLVEALAGLLNGVVNNIPVTKEEFGLIKAARAALAGT